MKSKKRGQTLIEVVLSLMILGLVLPLLVLSIGNLLHSQKVSRDYHRALILAQDGLEISYNLLQTDFANFPAGPGVYHPVINVDRWTLEVGEGEPVPGFSRQIEIKPLYRQDGDLVETEDGHPLEPTARRIEVTVSWQENSQKVVLAADFVNWENVVP